MDEDEVVRIYEVMIQERNDERITQAFLEENAYWKTPENRLHALKLRCHEAGYSTDLQY